MSILSINQEGTSPNTCINTLNCSDIYEGFWGTCNKVADTFNKYFYPMINSFLEMVVLGIGVATGVIFTMWAARDVLTGIFKQCLPH